MSVRRVVVESAVDSVDGAWRAVNRHRPRVLLYTDSRGMIVPPPPRLSLGRRHFGSHVGHLQRRFRVTHYVCRFKYTTILDFLTLVDKLDLGLFDAVILHCGVVDFCPRPLSSVQAIRRERVGVPRFERMFDRDRDHYVGSRGAVFEGEPTTTLYSLDYARHVAQELAKIEHLIWVSSNNFVPDWNGNWKSRPDGIDDAIRTYDALLLRTLPHTVDLHRWSDREIQRYTVDNVHFTRAGFRRVARSVEERLVEVLQSRGALASVAAA